MVLPSQNRYSLNEKGIPGGSDGKASAWNAGDLGSIPGLGRSPGEGNGNPLQYSCLENPMGGGAWWATIHWFAESDTTERLHLLTYSLPTLFHSATSHISLSILISRCQNIHKHPRIFTRENVYVKANRDRTKNNRASDKIVMCI